MSGVTCILHVELALYSGSPSNAKYHKADTLKPWGKKTERKDYAFHFRFLNQWKRHVPCLMFINLHTEIDIRFHTSFSEAVFGRASLEKSVLLFFSALCSVHSGL